MRISKIEKILITVFFFATWVALTAYAGGPIFSDEFLYIDLGLRGVSEPSYGNRYFHVYLQKLFIDIAPTPLWGVRAFWGLLMALTATLIYYNARTFTTHSTPLHGFIALAFFFSMPFITEYSGEPAVDITAMAMVIIYLTIYLAALGSENKRKPLTIFLGTLAFLAFKTKETTIFINFLLIGLILDADGKWQWKNLWEIIQRLLVGAGVGILLFILMDAVVLGDPFFAISPATIKAILTHYDFGLQFFNGPTNWYKVYFLNTILVPFLLYLMSCLKIQDNMTTHRKLVLMYPLLMAAFVTVNMLKIPWGFIERFYFPALPVVAFIAPQFLKVDLPKGWKQWTGFGLLAVASVLLLLAVRAWLKRVSFLLHFDFSRFLDSLYYPFLLSILLAAVIWVKKYNWAQAFLPLFCIAALLFSPLVYTHKYFFRIPKVRARYNEMMQPFSDFSSELALTEDERMYVSADLKRELDILSEDPNDITGMYNFYFDERISEKNVYMGYQRANLAADLLKKDFKFSVITDADWKSLEEIEVQSILSKYTLAKGSSTSFYLLSIK